MKKYLILSLITLIIASLFYIISLTHKTKLKDQITKKEIEKIVKNKTAKQIDQIDPKKLKSEYQKNIKEIFDSCLDLINNNKPEKIDSTEKDILSLKVPKEYKNLHISLMIAINNIKDFYKNKDNDKKLIALNLLNDIKDKYPWLNE